MQTIFIVLMIVTGLFAVIYLNDLPRYPTLTDMAKVWLMWLVFNIITAGILL